jgi:alkyldihydroxyacetonephosphate synthase
MSELAARTDDIATALGRMLGDKHASRAAAALAAIGASPQPGDAPAWLLEPGSAAEVAEVVQLAGRHRAAVIPVGNAARAPRDHRLRDRVRFFVDSRRMNHVLHLDETSLIAHVQAGLTGLALEKVLAPRGLSLGDYPPATLNSTIGGLLSVRTPGKSSPRHGFVEDAVLGVSAVLADGRTVHTRVAPRRATGPDLARALCGSEGTLGYITSAVLRIHRRPEARFLSAHALPSFDAALSAVHLALREEAAPSALRVFDGDEARIHLGEGVCERSEAVLTAATAGPTDLAACDRDLVASAAAAVGGRSLPQQVAERWWRRRFGQDPAPAPPVPTLQVTAPISREAPVYHAVQAAAREGGFAVRAHASRFDADGAVLFFTLTPPGDDAALSGAAREQARAAAQTAAQGAGAVLFDATNPSLQPYFLELRRQLDPGGVMNPGALRAPA